MTQLPSIDPDRNPAPRLTRAVVPWTLAILIVSFAVLAVAGRDLAVRIPVSGAGMLRGEPEPRVAVDVIGTEGKRVRIGDVASIELPTATAAGANHITGRVTDIAAVDSNEQELESRHINVSLDSSIALPIVLRSGRGPYPVRVTIMTGSGKIPKALSRLIGSRQR